MDDQTPRDPIFIEPDDHIIPDGLLLPHLGLKGNVTERINTNHQMPGNWVDRHPAHKRIEPVVEPPTFDSNELEQMAEHEPESRGLERILRVPKDSYKPER